MIPFTRRELENGWRDARNAYRSLANPTNSARLLLFYAVECGLKATILRRSRQYTTHSCFQDERHDLNRLMGSEHLRLGQDYRLPNTIHMKKINGNEQRQPACGDLNQIWRYGGCCVQPDDAELTTRLERIDRWIEGELR